MSQRNKNIGFGELSAEQFLIWISSQLRLEKKQSKNPN